MWFPIVPDRSWAAVIQDTVALFMDFTFNRDAARALAGAADMQADVETYVEVSDAARDRRFDEVWAAMAPPPGTAVLEIGACDLRMAARLTRAGWPVTAVEPVPEFLRRGEFDRGLDIPKICGSATRLPFGDATYDVVMCQSVLHHLDDMAAVTREMGRVLKPGGLFLASGEPVGAVGTDFGRLRRWAPEPAFDMGIHETMPRLAAFSRAMAAAGLTDTSAHCHPDDLMVPRGLARLGVARWMVTAGGPWTVGARMQLRHRLAHGFSTSFAARRGPGPVAKPAALAAGASPLFDPADYTDRRERAELTALWARLMRPEDVPAAIADAGADVYHLRRGFSRPAAPPSSGRGYKWIQARGALFLTRPPGHDTLRLDLWTPDAVAEPDGACPVDVTVGGVALEPADAAAGPFGPEWRRAMFRFPEAPDTATVAEILITPRRVVARDGLPAGPALGGIAWTGP